MNKPQGGMVMTTKQKLAKEYAILKKAVWAEEGVSEKNNKEESHFARAMGNLWTVSDLIAENARLTEKLCRHTV